MDINQTPSKCDKMPQRSDVCVCVHNAPINGMAHLAHLGEMGGFVLWISYIAP